jgi:hypothetical protein
MNYESAEVSRVVIGRVVHVYSVQKRIKAKFTISSKQCFIHVRYAHSLANQVGLHFSPFIFT